MNGPGTVTRIGRDGERSQELGVAHLHRAGAPDLAHDPRHGVRMPGPVERRPGLVEVEPLERVREVVRIALAADLAVRDDVDPRLLHVPHGEPRRVVLRLDEPGLVHAPELVRGNPRREPPGELLAVDQPVRLGVAADHCRRERVHR